MAAAAETSRKRPILRSDGADCSVMRDKIRRKAS